MVLLTQAISIIIFKILHTAANQNSKSIKGPFINFMHDVSAVEDRAEMINVMGCLKDFMTPTDRK